MSKTDEDLVFETGLDAPPDKVWRALTIPEYLERWLERPESVDVDQVAANEPHSVTYRWTERGSGDADPEESFVTFELTPRDNGGTWFRLTHRPAAPPTAANNNEAPMAMFMRAA
jgi:uncharacterized protein YndB with AHSA1/START domain